jgi:hypothetical protein
MKYQILENLTFLDKKLFLIQKRLAPKYYGDDISIEFEVIWEENNKKTIINSLTALAIFLNSEKNLKMTIIENNITIFSIITSYIINRGRVITLPSLFSFLEKDFNIKISEILPKIHAGIITYTTVDASLSSPTKLYNIELDMNNNLALQTIEKFHK